MKNTSLNSTAPLYITRFLAGYGVLLYHFLPKAYFTTDSLIARLDEAVNYFFFISGFVMVIANKKYFLSTEPSGTFPRSDFWIKRFARIYPLYILALLLCVLFHYFIQPYDSSIKYRFPLEALGIQRWFYSGSINFPGWSVSAEFLFYFLFPFIVPFLIRTQARKLLVLVILYLLINIGMSYTWSAWVVPASKGIPVVGTLNSSLLNHPIFKFSVFLAGNYCGLFFLKNAEWLKTMRRFSLMIAALSAASALFILWIFPKGSPVIHGGLLTPFYFIFTIAICNLDTISTKFLGNRLFIFLGEISYGVYILQFPVLLLFLNFYSNGQPLQTFMDFVLYSAVTILVSTVLYYTVEIPMKKKILQASGQLKNYLSRLRQRKLISVD